VLGAYLIKRVGLALLVGLTVSAIAFFLLNDPGQRRVVYHLFEKKRLPAFRLGKRIYARKSTLSAWIEALEAETNAQSPNFNKPAAPC